MDGCDGVATVLYQAPGERWNRVTAFFTATCATCGAQWTVDRGLSTAGQQASAGFGSGPSSRRRRWQPGRA